MNDISTNVSVAKIISMKNVSKLGIALCLAAATAGLNFFYLRNSQPKPYTFVGIGRQIAQGDPITADHLVEIAVPGEFEALKKSFVPWASRAMLIQLHTARRLDVGQLVLQQDVAEMLARAAGRKELLKFRVIAVGDRFKRKPGSTNVSSSGGNSNTVTIAVEQPRDDGTFDTATQPGRNAQRMVNVVTRQASGKDVPPEDRILGVAVYPPNSAGAAPTVGSPSGTPGTDEKLPPIEFPGPGEIALTIPLEGVDSVPAVILVGGEIGFFMVPEFPY